MAVTKTDLDEIFTEVALSGIDLRTMDMRLNDDDFAYVLNRYCAKHHIHVGSLHTREELMEKAMGNCTPNITCMMYMHRDDNIAKHRIRDRVLFLEFFSPAIAPGSAEAALRRLGAHLRTDFGIKPGKNIEPTVPQDPIVIDTADLPPIVLEHIPAKQPYYQMAVSQEDTEQLREQLQARLDQFNQMLYQKRPLDSASGRDIVQPGRQAFRIRIKYNKADMNVAVIEPAAAVRTEQVEARFQDLCVDFCREMERKTRGPKGWQGIRVATDGNKIIISGEKAYELALIVANQVDKFNKIAASPARKKRRYDITAEEPVQPPAPQETLDTFLASTAFRAIQTEQHELVTGTNTLNPRGTIVQMGLMGIIKDYLATKGITTLEQLKNSITPKQITEHHDGINHRFTVMEPPQYVNTSLVQNAAIVFLRQLKAMQQNLGQDGNAIG